MKPVTNILFLTLCATSVTFSQSQRDSISISLPDAEKQFSEKNLILLASKYEIEATKAYEVQARLLDNPNFYIEQSTYNRYSNRYLPGKTSYSDGSLGQNQMSINQLFSIAGKRNKRLKLAKAGTQVAQYQFYDVLRTLLFQLRSNFYDLYFSLKNYALYSEHISALEKNLTFFKTQVDKGNVSLSEYLRLTAFVNSMKKERRDVQEEIYKAENVLHVLLADTSSASFKPLLNEKDSLSSAILSTGLTPLIDTAVSNRADAKVAEFLMKQERANMEYQRAAAIPDLMLAGTYDRNGSYIQNYYGVGLGFQVPIYNRNQGNIKASKARLKEAELNQQESKLNIEQDVIAAYKNYVDCANLHNTSDRSLEGKFASTMKGLNENYSKKNIGVIEFIDYYDSFKNVIIQFNRIRNDYYNSMQNLNYEVGKTIFK